MAYDCRKCKYFERDVDLPHPVCTYHQFHFEGDYTPCSDYDGPTESSSSSSSYSSSDSGSMGKGCAIAIVIAIVIAVGALLFSTGMFNSVLSLVGIGASSEAEGPTGERAVINTDNINMRKDPSMNAKVITKLKKGEVVYIQGKQDGWTQIIVEKTGEIGWCSSNFLTVEK